MRWSGQTAPPARGSVLQDAEHYMATTAHFALAGSQRAAMGQPAAISRRFVACFSSSHHSYLLPLQSGGSIVTLSQPGKRDNFGVSPLSRYAIVCFCYFCEFFLSGCAVGRHSCWLTVARNVDFYAITCAEQGSESVVFAD